MKDVYTIDDLRNWSDETIRLGVIGDPVEHSLSPQMMNAALEQWDLPHRYARFHIRAGELREALQLMRERDFVGANITVPHKVQALDAMDFVDDMVREIGAINTVQFRHGKLRGFNTDATGFEKAVQEEFGVRLRDVRVVILGAGGASRAIEHVCERVRVWSRRDSASAAEAIRDADLIVNATPVGLSKAPGNVGGLRSPSAVIELGELDPPLLTRQNIRADQMVFDTIYSPPRTKLLEEAAAAGARVANGLSMLLHQGAAAFEVWFNRPAPVEVMRAALGRGGPRSPSAADRARRSRSTKGSAAADRARRSRSTRPTRRVFPAKLHHEVPSWVEPGSLFHIRIALDRRVEQRPLINPDIATALLESARLYEQKQRWHVRLFLIMPDHVHGLLSFPSEQAMSKVIGDWKRFHARERGIIWQDGYFDHRLRDDERGEQLEVKLTYIRNNPVAAGLCKGAEQWPWVYPTR